MRMRTESRMASNFETFKIGGKTKSKTIKTFPFFIFRHFFLSAAENYDRFDGRVERNVKFNKRSRYDGRSIASTNVRRIEIKRK